MDTSKPKSRKQLNDKQKDILLILYKFRFITVELVVKYQKDISRRYTNTRLRILLEQEYIGRNYDANYRIDRKQAIYYLLPNGINFLKKDPDLNSIVLNTIYDDKKRTSQFINHCLDFLKLYLKLHDLYGSSLSFYSKSEQAEYDYFPRPLPDAYFILETEQTSSQYMLEIVEASTQSWVIKKTLKRYINHVESGDWDETDSDYPTLLLVCETPSLERRIQQQATKLLDNSDTDELTIYTTTTKALMDSNSPKDTIWSDVNEPDTLATL
jgi:hypothetical protein